MRNTNLLINYNLIWFRWQLDFYQWYRNKIFAARENPRNVFLTFFFPSPPRCPTAGCSGLHSRAWQGKPIKCPDCQKKICLEDRLACLRECEALYERGLADMEDEMVDKAIGTLGDALKRFHQVACPPHRDTHLAEIALSSCLADYGNTWRPAALWRARRRRGKLTWTDPVTTRATTGVRRCPSNKRGTRLIVERERCGRTRFGRPHIAIRWNVHPANILYYFRRKCIIY